MEESAVILIISGDIYESKKDSFAKLRKDNNLISVMGNQSRHVWIVEDQTISCDYDRDSSGVLNSVSITWKGHNMTSLLKSIIKIFLEAKNNV